MCKSHSQRLTNESSDLSIGVVSGGSLKSENPPPEATCYVNKDAKHIEMKAVDLHEGLWLCGPLPGKQEWPDLFVVRMI